MKKMKEDTIRNFIRAYNNFDVDSMLIDLHPEIEFVNISNGVVNLTLNGIDNFKRQAEQTKNLFTQRHQEIISISPFSTHIEVEINYKGVLAIDLPNGLKKGDTLELKGKSIFKFSREKIIQLTDIS